MGVNTMGISRRRSFSLILAAVGGTLALSCSKSTPTPPTPEEREAAIVVTVNNKAYSDVNVYAVAQGQSRRIGTARATATTTLSMPASYLTPTSRTVRLKGSPVAGGGRDVLSQQITVQPGAIIEWTIENNLASSSVFLK
jgi:hypothetical protein